MTRREYRRLPLSALLLVAALTACKPATKGSAASAAETPSPEVSVTAVEAATVPRTFDLPGRLASTRVAEVRA